MSDAVLRASSDAVKGLISAWVQLRRLKAEDERHLRREAAADLLSWIPELRARLYRLESGKCDRKACRRVMVEAYESVRRVRHRTPRGWRHLRLSLFDAIGNGAGSLVWIDVSPSAANRALTYDHRWTGNAAEYLGHMQDAVQRWGDSYERRAADRVLLLSYSEWLERSGY